MKSINNFIFERLKLNNDSKVKKHPNFKGYDESILDVNINDINELKEVLTNYFNKPTIEIEKDFLTNHRINDNNCKCYLEKSFKIKELSKHSGWLINVGETTYKEIVLQYYRYWETSKGRGNWHKSKIIGVDGNAYQYGTNFLDWLYKAKKETVDNIVNVNLFAGFGLEKE